MPDGLLGAKLRRVPSPPLLQLRSHPGQRAAPASRRRHPAHSAGRESSCRNMLADRSHIAYSHFAPRAPHLYAVMFGPGLAEFRTGDPADLEAARSTFVSLFRRIHVCVNAGRWKVANVTTAGDAAWSGVHGHTTLELTGFFGAVGRDPVRSYTEILTRMSIGLGDDARSTTRSLSNSRRRAVRPDRAEITTA